MQDDVQECPITDIMPYNQSLPRREEDVHAMNDLMLSFRLETPPVEEIFHSCNNGKDVFQVEIDPQAGAYRVTRNGHEISPEDNRIPSKTRTWKLLSR